MLKRVLIIGVLLLMALGFWISLNRHVLNFEEVPPTSIQATVKEMIPNEEKIVENHLISVKTPFGSVGVF
ncbi:MAG: hypothetical protein KC713_09695 [Candidatus Omnitrophica bacterium]|nr:hypothetical protein [Candidatus Omnitrophota bacterium]